MAVTGKVSSYPFRAFRYQVQMGNSVMSRTSFSEVSGISLNVQAIDYREGDDIRNVPRKIPGLTTFGNVTFRWGVSSDKDFLDWIHSVAPNNQAGPVGIKRSDITITLIDDKGEAGSVWTLINAWPVSFSGPDLSGMGNEVAIASLEVCCEGVWQTSSVSGGTASTV